MAEVTFYRGDDSIGGLAEHAAQHEEMRGSARVLDADTVDPEMRFVRYPLPKHERVPCEECGKDARFVYWWHSDELHQAMTPPGAFCSLTCRQRLLGS